MVLGAPNHPTSHCPDLSSLPLDSLDLASNPAHLDGLLQTGHVKTSNLEARHKLRAGSTQIIFLQTLELHHSVC